MNTHLLKQSPSGHLVAIEQGQWAFVPHPLPRAIDLDRRLVFLLDEASRAVATLSGVGETLPNANLLVQPFLRREAVLSSRIEGTQTLLPDLLLFEASNNIQDPKGDAKEVLNYLRAMEIGLTRLQHLPIVTRLINDLHSTLLDGVRGDDRQNGQLRSSQVYIGAPGSPIEQARYIPPPPGLLGELLADWERFTNEAEVEMPPLVQAALMHYQFEAIHPYVDGNGRLGRLLIVLFLCLREVLTTPLLYLSAYFESHREEYYDQLLGVSITGNWKPWLEFFLKGVGDQARDALLRSRRVRELHASYVRRLQEREESANAFRIVDQFFTRPITTPAQAANFLGITRAGARALLDRLVTAGILSLLSTGRPRFYIARELFEAIQ